MEDTDELLAVITPLVDRCYTDVSAVKSPKGGSYWTQDRLTDKRLRDHVEGKTARGLGLIAPGEDTVRAAVLDLDDHDDSMGFDTIRESVGTVLEAGTAYGLHGHPWRSSGGGGAHIYYIWQDSQDAYSVREALRQVLANAGLTDGTGGLQARAVEVFPKQNAVPDDGYGNHFILPLAGQSTPLEPLLDYEPVALYGLYHWTTSEPVPVLERPQLPTPAGGGDVSLAEIESALGAIPNEGAGLDYDAWRDVIFGIHYVDSGSDGLALAEAFSARSDKHDPNFLAERVWPYIRSQRSNVITGRTVTAKARKHGWSPSDDVIAREFEFNAPAEADQANKDGTEPGEMPRGLMRDKSGMIKVTVRNVTNVMLRPDLIGYQIGNDAFLGAIMVAQHERQWRPVNDEDYTTLRRRLEALGFYPVGREMVRDAVAWVASRNEFDSAVQWLTEELPTWDGVPRAQRFFIDYMGVDDCAYARACGRYFWTALAGRVLRPGAKADMIPVIISPQGRGKSSGAKAIVPDDQFFFEVDLRNADADIARQMRGKLIGELDELRGMTRRDMEHVKSFVSRTHEQWIPKYRENAFTYPRRCMFIGTSNEQHFLTDETGHRRFLPMMAGQVDVERIEQDRAQLWAEARELFRAEGVAYREVERLAREVHNHHQWSDPWEQPVADWLASESLIKEGEARGDQLFGTEEVLREALSMPAARQTNADAKRVGAVLRRLGYERKHARKDGVRGYYWMR